MKIFNFKIIFFYSLILAACSVSIAARDELSSSRPGKINQDITSGWSTYGGAPGGSKYSSLTQINLDNINKLKQAWIYHSGDVSDGSNDILPTALQVTPIFENDTLYFCTPYNRVIALDAATGEERWSFDPRIDLTTSNVGIHHCRGVAFWQTSNKTDPPEVCSRRIFLGTGDGRVFAIGADSGKVCDDFGEQGQVNLNHLEKNGTGKIGISSPPAIYNDNVIVGSMIPSYERTDSPDGIVWAFDAVSGEVNWKWNPVPTQLRNQSGGINVWAPLSVDTEEGLIFLPTSSPTPDTFGGQRKEAIPFANAVVALDGATGIPRWHFQAVHHDLWDYDLPAQPTLITVQRDGKPVPAVAQVTKMGFVFILDRSTGKPLFSIEERAVPGSDVAGEMSSPTQPYPVLPLPIARQHLDDDEAWGLTFWDKGWCRDKISGMRNEGLYTPPSTQGTVQIPSAAGGPNWGGAAFDPVSKLLVVNVTNVAGYLRLIPRQEYDLDRSKSGIDSGLMIGTPYVMESGPLLSPLGIPCSPPPWGELSAIDVSTGAIRWRLPLGSIKLAGPVTTPHSWGSPNIGGAIITAGGLVFIAATMDHQFRAIDLKSGKQVWSATLPSPGMATPMTYASSTNQQQYVIIAAGGHPSYKTKVGDAIIAYTLIQD